MNSFVLNGETWRVVTVRPGDPLLIDRTGNIRLATTDPRKRTIYVSGELRYPFIDRVLLHEVSHAITISYGLLDVIHKLVPEDSWVKIEELFSQIFEQFSIEAAIITSGSLGRPVCVREYCIGDYHEY